MGQEATVTQLDERREKAERARKALEPKTMVWKCSNCGASVSADQKQCSECGAAR